MARTDPRRLGFFTRLLDQATAGERYRLAAEQIVHAERHGFDSACVAQHHFDGDEGGLPAPFVFLAHVAARTSRIRLGTGIVTLPLEEPVRVAEDASVLDLISNGRLELGLGSGGTPSAFAGFGRDSADRAAIFEGNATIVRDALARNRRSDLAGDVLGCRRNASRRRGRRPDAVSHPTTTEGHAERVACGITTSNHRRLSRGAAGRAGTTHHGLPHPVRGRRPKRSATTRGYRAQPGRRSSRRGRFCSVWTIAS